MDKPEIVSLMSKRKSPAVTRKMASRIKAMLETGMAQHDIAAHFGVNQGRISEIKTGLKFQCVEPVQGDLFSDLAEVK